MQEHDDDTITDKPDDSLDYNKGVWFQSECSGAWYMSNKAAGEIMAVKIDGLIFAPVVA